MKYVRYEHERREPDSMPGAMDDSLVVRWIVNVVFWSLFVSWQLVRVVICALLVLFEPIVRAVLVPLAFLSFWVTLLFGFLIGDPRFPRWGMLAFSVGALVLYWLYMALMGLFMALPRMTVRVDEAQLQRIARERKFDPRTLEIARRLFIHNERVKLLSAEYGVIFQRIYAIRKAVLDAIEEDALEPGWARLTLLGPTEAVEAARRAFEKRMAQLEGKKP